jgi:hypothetical protein
LNNSRFLFDHITWVVHYIDHLLEYLSSESLQVLANAGGAMTGVAFTFLSYPHAIVSSCSDRLKQVPDIHCPLFKSLTAMLNNKSVHLNSVSHLNMRASRIQLLKELDQGKTTKSNQDFKYFFAV